MSCREDRPVGAKRKEAVQIRLSRGLARHGMTAVGRCKMHVDSLPAHFLSQYFPIRVPSLASHVPTIQPSGFLSGTSSCLALFWYCPILTPDLVQEKKVGSTIAR